jgi:hypothetical protein
MDNYHHPWAAFIPARWALRKLVPYGDRHGAKSGAIPGRASVVVHRVTLGGAMTRQDLEQRVTRAAETALAEQRFVSAIDVLLGLGWLAPYSSHVSRRRPPT